MKMRKSIWMMRRCSERENDDDDDDHDYDHDHDYLIMTMTMIKIQMLIRRYFENMQRLNMVT